VADVGVWKIDNPYLNVSFERRTQGMLSLDCWVDAGDLTDENPLMEVSLATTGQAAAAPFLTRPAATQVCRRGFIVPHDSLGLSFQHGNIVLDDSNEEFLPEAGKGGGSGAGPSAAGGGLQHHLYVFCTVGVGRSYVLDKRDAKAPAIPPGYDSLYVAKGVLDRDGDGQLSAEEYEAAATHDSRDPADYRYEYVVQVSCRRDGEGTSDRAGLMRRGVGHRTPCKCYRATW
jgi:hypothetical protein